MNMRNGSTRRRPWAILFTLLLALPVASCNDDALIKEAADQLFPPVRPAQLQLAAVQAADEQLQSLDPAPLYVAVGRADFIALLPGAIGERSAATGLAVRAGDLRIDLRDQEVVVTTSFDLQFGSAGDRVAGDAEVHCAVAIERGALVLRPSASSIRVTGGSYQGHVAAALLKPALNAALRTFLDNFNGAIAAPRLPLRLQAIEHLDLAAALQGVQSVAKVNAPIIDLNLGLGAAALLIDAEGIHVMADAVVLTPGRIAATLEELRQDLAQKRTPPLTSNQMALLGECGRSLVLAEPAVQTFAAVCAAFANLPAAASAAGEAPATGAEAALPAAVQKLQQHFRTKVEGIEPIANIGWNRTAAAFSRAQISAGLNEILPGIAVQATLRPADLSADIAPEDRTIRTPSAPALHCDQAGGACPSVFSYPPYQPRGCPSDCSLLDIGCHAWKPQCEVLKQGEKTAYEATKATVQAAWSADKLRCEAAKTAQQAGCLINQGWLDKVANLDLGELRGGIALRQIEIDVTVDQVILGADFDQLSFRLAAAGGAGIDGAVTLVPHNLGNLVCVAQWDATLRARVGLPLQSQTLRLQRTAVTSPGDGLLLTFQLPAVPLQLRFEPPPVQAFVAQNAGKLALNCPLPAGLLAGLAGYPPAGLPVALSLQREVLGDTYDVSVPARQVSVVVPSQEIGFRGHSVHVVPAWGERAFVLSANLK
jgi:hypothetical protein